MEINYFSLSHPQLIMAIYLFIAGKHEMTLIWMDYMCCSSEVLHVNMRYDTAAKDDLPKTLSLIQLSA